jgi:peroxiredoxin
LTDTNAEWSKVLGLQIDLTEKGFGLRTGRFAIIVDNLVIKYIGVRSALTSWTNSWLTLFLYSRLNPDQGFPSRELMKF